MGNKNTIEFETEEQYFAYKALSASQIKQYATGGAYEFWKNSVFNPDFQPSTETDALIFGKMAHCMLFEQSEFEKRFMVMDWGTKTRKTKKYEETKLLYPDKIIVSPDEYQKAGKMLSCLMDNRLVREIVKDAYCETPICWTDEKTGLPCKCKIDAFKNTPYGLVVIDYKTSADIDSLLHCAQKYQYPIQACTYAQAVKEKYGRDVVEFVFIIQSNKDGDEDKICVANVDPDTQSYADGLTDYYKQEIADKLKKWDETHDKNIWAAYPERMMMSYSDWYMKQGLPF